VEPGYEEPMSASLYEKTVGYFDELLQMLHPFMPFITEEIYHQLSERTTGDDLVIRQNAEPTEWDEKVLESGKLLQEAITAIRDARNKNRVKNKETIRLHIEAHTPETYVNIEPLLAKQVNAASTHFVSEPPPQTIAILIRKDRFFLETETSAALDTQREQMEEDLEDLKGFLASVEKKLSNDRFVQNAKPEVVEIERNKKRDAEEKIKAIEASLAGN